MSSGRGLVVPTNPLAREGSTPSVACSVPRSGLEMPLAFQAQDLDEINPGQASAFATPDQSQLGGTHKSGQQQDARDRDPSAGLGADPVISSRAFGGYCCDALAKHNRDIDHSNGVLAAG